MKKLAIVVGHNSQAQGAVRGDTGESEYVWNGRLAQIMERIAPEFGVDLRVFRRVAGGGYRTEIHRVYSEVDQWGADASIELHFNGAASEAATGTETLSSGTALSLRLAQAVQDEMVIALGLRDRGVKTVGGDGRGGASLISGRAPAILVEPFFGSSPKGQAASDEVREQEALARAYLRGASVALGSYPRRNLSESTTLIAAAKAEAAQTGQAIAGGAAGIGVALQQAQDQLAAVPLIGPLADWMPLINTGLILAVVGFTIYQRVQTAQIKSSRIKAAERELHG